MRMNIPLNQADGCAGRPEGAIKAPFSVVLSGIGLA